MSRDERIDATIKAFGDASFLFGAGGLYSDAYEVDAASAEAALRAAIAEPVEITDEMVERGAAGLFRDNARSSTGSIPPFREMAPIIRESFERQARIVLDAALAEARHDPR